MKSRVRPPVDYVLKALHEFLRLEAAGGLILIGSLVSGLLGFAVLRVSLRGRDGAPGV